MERITTDDIEKVKRGRGLSFSDLADNFDDFQLKTKMRLTYEKKHLICLEKTEKALRSVGVWMCFEEI